MTEAQDDARLLRVIAQRDKALTENQQLREALKRAAFISEHLFQMIDPQTWRDSGGDDGQGHYEGDYHAAKTRDEIAAWAALARVEKSE